MRVELFQRSSALKYMFEQTYQHKAKKLIKWFQYFRKAHRGSDKLKTVWNWSMKEIFILLIAL